MPVPGDTLIDRATVIDAYGVPLTGVSFTVDAVGPDNLPRVADAVTEIGPGIYQFSVPTLITDPVGTYYLRAITDTTPAQTKEFEWDMRPIGTTDRWKPGDTMMDYITVIDANNDPVVGDVFTIMALNTAGNRFPIPTPVEVLPGTYRVAVPTSRFDPPGVYYIRLVSTLVPTQVYEIKFTTGQPLAITGGITLRTLRRRVMSRIGDLLRCTATQDSDNTQIIDQTNLVGEPARYAGREIMFVTGLNSGERRYIAGSSRDTSSVRFSYPLPYPVAIGDEADITNAYGTGITFQETDDAIAWAFDIARSRARIPVNYRVTAWNGTDVIPIPAEVVGVNDVYSVDEQNQQQRVERSNRRDNGWFIDQPNRSIVINGVAGYGARNHAVVVNAWVLPRMLIDEDDVTTLPVAWLVDMAASHLCLDTLATRNAGGDWASKGLMYQQNADKIITMLTPNMGTNYQAVRGQW